MPHAQQDVVGNGDSPCRRRADSLRPTVVRHDADSGRPMGFYASLSRRPLGSGISAGGGEAAHKARHCWTRRRTLAVGGIRVSTPT